jgi:hypothetical protein
MNKKVENDEIGLDEFKQCLTIFKNMLDDGDAEFNFSPVGLNVFTKSDRLDDELISAMIDEKQYATCQSEALRLLNVIMRDDEGKFLGRIPDDKRDEMERKCELIEKELITKELIEKFIFQTTCKNLLLNNFDWEILKHQGKEGDTLYSAVQMQFLLRNPSKEVSMKMMGIESISFECQKKDVEKLIEDLMKIKEVFEK